MIVFDTSNEAARNALKGPHTFWLYNGLDATLTKEVFEQIRPQLVARPTLTEDGPRCFENEVYKFARAMQAPVMDMMRVGLKVDEYARGVLIHSLSKERVKLKARLMRFIFEGMEASTEEHPWLKDFNINSINPPSETSPHGGNVQRLLYELLALPPVMGEKGKPSVDRDALEKLEKYPVAQPICSLLLALRDIKKNLEDLNTEIDTDKRIRTTFGVAATKTGRMASYKAGNGKGRNLQNIDPMFRHIYCADKGRKYAYIDLEQAESRMVGAIVWSLFGDPTYLDATESADLHTAVASMTWPHIKTREQAEEIFYRNFSYRFMSKRLGHGCLTPDHEVLTRNGWVSILEKPEEIMVWNEDRSFFAKPSAWFDFEYEGDLVSVEGRSLSLLMTGNHRVIYQNDDTGFRECRADGLKSSFKIPLGMNYEGGSAPITPEIARLWAAIQCDGSLQSKTSARFHMKKERKFARLEHLCAEAGIEYIRSKPDKCVIRLSVPKKAGPYLLNWPKEALLAYVKEHKFWDGHQNKPVSGCKGQVTIFSKDREHLEWLQTCGRLLGIGGNFSKIYKSGYGTDISRLQQNARLYGMVGRAETRIERGKSRVLCPTVETGAFYVRRKGKISVTGNSSYYGKPRRLSQETSVPIKMVEEFQEKFFAAFPGIQRWHHWVSQQLAVQGYLVSLMGRKRWFMGRADEDSTLREAIAYDPQNSIAELLNRGLFRLWYKTKTDPKNFPIRCLLQVHDAILLDYSEDEDESVLIPRLMETITTPILLRHKDLRRELIVPTAAEVGYNWGHHTESNVDGLIKWSAGKPDARTRQNDPQRDFLLG